LLGGTEVKIVAVTASVFKEQQEEMLTAGMDGFVRKPYRFNEIYDSLAQQLGLRYVSAEPVAEQAMPVLDAKRLGALPEAVRVELKEALESLEVHAIANAIRHVGKRDAELANTLFRIADGLNYPAIIAAIDKAGR
jgi:CheY-like chemotaxis protein